MTNLHRLAAALFILILWVPIAQQIFTLVPPITLAGTESKAKFPGTPSLSTYWDGSYQKGFDRWFSQSMGLREHMVKTDNQIRYTCFGALKGDLIEGRENFVFEWNYYPHRYWTDIHLYRRIYRRLRQMNRLHRTLREHGGRGRLLLSPIKTNLYAEFLPPSGAALEAMDKPSTIQRARESLEKIGMPAWDFSRRFEEWKPEAKAPLFAQGGVHWSMFGAALAAEEVHAEILDQLGLESPILKVIPGPLVSTSHPSDTDIGRMSNLWQGNPFQGPSQSYEIEVERKPGDRKLKILLIGSSFCWAIGSALRPACEKVSCYYYARSLYESDEKGEWGPPSPMPEGDALRDHLLSYDYVIFEANETHLGDISFGFLAKALESFDVYPESITLEPNQTEIFAQSEETQVIEMKIETEGEWANCGYHIVGTISGSEPGMNFSGEILPLNWDLYSRFTVAVANSALLPGFRGTLDSLGRAQASLVVPPRAAMNLTKEITVHHVAVVIDTNGAVLATSKPMPMIVKPEAPPR